MPCNNDGYPPTQDELDARKHGARLCAVFSVLETMGILNEVFDRADWREAGVSRANTENWWARHKEADRLRRRREAAERKLERERAKAIAELTPKQRKALGL